MDNSEKHSEVAEFLGRTAQSSLVLETHAARIVLAGDRAYKLKKHVLLPFLDFTTLDAREHALRRELELNAPHAPGIYRAVRRVTREADGSLALDGQGAVVDWVLEMTRFEGAALLLEIAKTGPLDRSLAEKLAWMAADYHAASPIRYRSDGTSTVMGTVEGLIESLQLAACPRAQGGTVTFGMAARDAVRRLSPLLDARAIGGGVRRCHGDLHLGNIVLIDGNPVPFDALEFDEALAETDVLYDLAFLLMDLLRLGDRIAANVVLNSYVRRAPLGTEIDGLATLPLFLAMRAAVRSVVAFMRERQGHSTRDEEEALALLDMACRSLRPEQPCLVAIGGFSGSGKTTMARGLAPSLPSPAGALHVRTDVERKKLFGVSEQERLSETHYTQAVSDHVYQTTFAIAGRALDQGHSVIVDAVFSKYEEREAIAQIAKAKGARFLGLWLEAPAEDLIARVEGRRGDASDATAKVVTRQLAQSIGRMSWTRVQTRGSEAESLARVVEAARTAGLLAAARPTPLCPTSTEETQP